MKTTSMSMEEDSMRRIYHPEINLDRARFIDSLNRTTPKQYGLYLQNKRSYKMKKKQNNIK